MPKAAKSYKRRPAFREPYDSVLIVCEGLRSEPDYLRGLCIDKQLSAVNIKVVTSPGTDPVSIVNYAIEEDKRAAEQDRKSGEASRVGYDRVYCVFDRIGHTNFLPAIQAVGAYSGRRGDVFEAIVSSPCFEVWVLLHYQYSSAAFVSSGGRTECENVIKKIKEFLPQYTKSLTDLYEVLKPAMNAAMTNAKRLKVYNAKNGSVNPDTDMHILIEYLLNLKT